MAAVQKSVSVAKECDDVMKLLVGVVKHVKDGKGLSEATELLDELMAAISGIDQVDDEWAADKDSVLNAVLLGASGLAAALMAKPPAPPAP